MTTTGSGVTGGRRNRGRNETIKRHRFMRSVVIVVDGRSLSLMEDGYVSIFRN